MISDDRVAPTATVPGGPACPGGTICPFAAGWGGGIGNWGVMRLDHVTVAGNLAGGAVASDANGAGIMKWFTATIAISHGTVTGNRAVVTEPNGRFADSGGIYDMDGQMTIDHSVISNNAAPISSTFPSSVDTLAIAGGIHVRGGATATISTSEIDGTRCAPRTRRTLRRRTRAACTPTLPSRLRTSLSTGTG